MKMMVGKHRFKLMALGGMGNISKEVYNESYKANLDKMLKEGTLELFLDPR